MKRAARQAGLGIAALVTLAACAAVGPAPGTAVIVVSSGGFFGSTSMQIFADGTLIGTLTAPGKDPVRTVTKDRPEVYARAAAVLAAEGEATRRALKPVVVQCLDYGADQVTATPAVAGFDGVIATCPDAAVTALMDHVLATLAQP